MTALTVAGGVYHERCIWPDWDQIYGSAGRAAAAVVDQLDKVSLVSYLRVDTREHFQPYADAYGIETNLLESPQTISFEYTHSLSTPTIRPTLSAVQRLPPLDVTGDVVLRFGMLESTVRVNARKCVYDPQSAFLPEAFSANGSRADALAIVGNATEIAALSEEISPIVGAQKLVESGRANIVIVKDGPRGAWVIDTDRQVQVPAYQTQNVWTIGTGDVFAAVFAAQWGALEIDAIEAAMLASRAVAFYVENMALPVLKKDLAAQNPWSAVSVRKGRVYLAAPFFCLGQRWIVDETRHYLQNFGMDVFSPVHDIGPGPAHMVAPADLDALEKCDIVFALLDGLDPGTLFEVGYASSKGIPIYALAQAVSEEDLKMFVGSGTKVYADYVTAIHHAVWRT